MSGIKQFSRDFSEDPDYSPAWRANQAYEYRRVHKELLTRGEENIVVIPEGEDDDYIIDYFSLLVYGTCHFPEIKYAHSCHSSNNIRGFGTQIQAMYLGKKDIAEIAENFKTKPKNIECYIKMFFDVTRYMDCENLIYSIISPYNRWNETPLDMVANSIWLGISYEFGWDTAKYLLQRRLNIDQDVSDKLASSMKKALELQASEYVLGVRLVSHARPSDFERHIAMTNAMSIAEQNKSQDSISSGEFFRNSLWSCIKDVSSTLDRNDPVRKLIGDKEAALRLDDGKSQTELTYFTPQAL